MNHVSGKSPQRLYYRIQEVSQITGVKPHVLRYWETEFPLLKPRKGSNDQRRYRQSDIELVLKIKKLLYEEGFTIAGARRQLGRGGNGRSARAQSRSSRGPRRASAAKLGRIAKRLGRVRKELVELQGMLAN